jgi:hypothetical protein
MTVLLAIGICTLAGTQQLIEQPIHIIIPSTTFDLPMRKFILNANHSLDFAVFPNIVHPVRDFARAPVRLQEGNGRWGLRHIEIAHAAEIARLKLDAITFISSIVKPGSPIYCEFESFKASQRTQAVNLRIGTAILEYKVTREGAFYTIITAYSRKQPLGELIGRLE